MTLRKTGEEEAKLVILKCMLEEQRGFKGASKTLYKDST